MEIGLSEQPPACNQTLNNFIERNEAELINTSQDVKVLFYDWELPPIDPYFNFIKGTMIYIKFLNPQFENNIVKYDIFGINKGKGNIKFKNENDIYDLINGLFIKDGLVDKNNNKAITVRIYSLGQYLTNKCFVIDGSELVINRKLVLSGD